MLTTTAKHRPTIIPICSLPHHLRLKIALSRYWGGFSNEILKGLSHVRLSCMDGSDAAL